MGSKFKVVKPPRADITARPSVHHQSCVPAPPAERQKAEEERPEMEGSMHMPHAHHSILTSQHLTFKKCLPQ